MCGIVGYIGPRQAAGLIIEGLRRLEYRGYDSAGIAVINGAGLKITKAAGKLSVLEQELKDRMPSGTIGIGHTRWATHGAPTSINAHPHTDQSGRIALIHNGIIENSGAIRKALEQRGHTFKSETDTEVLAHLVGEFYQGNLEEALAAALQRRRRRLWPRAHLRRRAGRAGGGPEGLAAAGGRGRERVLRRVRRVAAPPAHPLRGLSRRRRDGGAQPRRLPRPQPRNDADQQAGEPDRLGHGHGGAQRLRALHAQGNLRAAGKPLQHAARPPARR